MFGVLSRVAKAGLVLYLASKAGVRLFSSAGRPLPLVSEGTFLFRPSLFSRGWFIVTWGTRPLDSRSLKLFSGCLGKGKRLGQEVISTTRKTRLCRNFHFHSLALPCGMAQGIAARWTQGSALGARAAWLVGSQGKTLPKNPLRPLEASFRRRPEES